MLFLFSLFLFAGRGSGTDVLISSYPDGCAPTKQAEEAAVDFVSPVRDRHCKKMEPNPENHFSPSPKRSVQGDTRNSSFSPERSAARELLKKNYAFLYPDNEIDHVRQPELGEKCPPVCTAKNNGNSSDSNFFAVDTGALSGQSQGDDDFNEQLSAHIKQKKEKHDLVFTSDVTKPEEQYKMLAKAVQMIQGSANSRTVMRFIATVKGHKLDLIESYETPAGHLWEIDVNGVSVFIYTLTHHGNQIEDQIRAINKYYLDLLQEFIVEGPKVIPALKIEDGVKAEEHAEIKAQESNKETKATITEEEETEARRRLVEQQEETAERIATAQRQAQAKRKTEEEAAQAERARQIEKSRIEAAEAIARFIDQETKELNERQIAETTARNKLTAQKQKDREEKEAQTAIKKKTEEEEAAKIAAAQPVTTDGASLVGKVLQTANWFIEGLERFFNTGADGSDEAINYALDDCM